MSPTPRPRDLKTMMRSIACCFSAAAAWHQPGQEPIGCTAVAIDSAATADGSAFAGMNADTGGGDYRLAYVPAKNHSVGAMRPVYTFDLQYPRFVGYGRGKFYHPFPGHEILSKPVGHIPEVKSTYGYYENALPLMNEKGLGMGESSCAAMLTNRFPDDEHDTRDVPTGMLDTATLMQLAMERCATARCAVELMGSLSEEFGFVPTPGEPAPGRIFGQPIFDDAGETYTFADSLGEAWIFHVLGGVTDITKSVWAARRVPKGHFAVIVNEFMLDEVPTQPTEDFIYNSKLFEAAKAAGLWSRGPLHFGKTFAPNSSYFEAPASAAPWTLYATTRRWNLHKLVAPSWDFPFHANNMEYPFSVKVEQKLTHRDVQALFGTQYEGTEFDMRQGILAGPFGNPFRIEGGPFSLGQPMRGVAITRTLYGIIVQPGKHMAWFCIDVPTTSVYVPLFAATDAVASVFSTGHQQEFSRITAGWAFNFVNNYMQLNYKAMSENEVYPKKKEWQDRIDGQLDALAASSPSELKAMQISIQETLVADWWKLADWICMKYNDGRVNYPKLNEMHGYPEPYAKMVGFNQDVRPLWVKPADVPPVHMPGYVPKSTALPTRWDSKTETWHFESMETGCSATLAESAAVPSKLSSLGFHAVTACVAVCVGLVLGRLQERQRRVASDAHLPLL